MDTNPQAEVADPEDRFAALFGEKPEKAEPEKSETTETPEAQEATEEPKEEAAEEGQAEPEVEEAEEVEYEGKTYALPKELKEAVLRQKDYTQKTQQVAEQRRELEALKEQTQQIEQFREKQFSAAVALSQLDSQLKQYQGLDWNGLATTDPAEFIRLDRMQRQLQEQFNAQKQSIQEAMAQEKQLTDKQRQQLLEKGQAELARDIKGWNAELAKAIVSHGKSYGYSDTELSVITDPRQVKVLHDAYQWRKLQEAKPALQKRIAEVKPIKATARSNQATQQTAKEQDARARLKKTGSNQDAEDAFYMRFAKKYK